MSAIYILWLRQLKRYVRSRARMVGSLAQPLLFLFAMGFGFGPVFKQAGNGNYLQFLAPGIVVMAILFTAVFSGIEILWDRQFGFLKETLVAPLPRMQIVLGRTLGAATVAVIQGLVVLLVCLCAGYRIQNFTLLPVAFAFMLLIAVLFVSIGTAIGSLLEDMQAFPLIMNFLVMPLFFFSSAIYPLTGLPTALQWLARLDPLTYGVDGLRGALGGQLLLGLGPDLLILSCLSLIFFGIGSYFFSRIQI